MTCRSPFRRAFGGGHRFARPSWRKGDGGAGDVAAAAPDPRRHRLDDERAATLELIARAEDKTVTDTVRTAFDEHIEARRKDKGVHGSPQEASRARART